MDSKNSMKIQNKEITLNEKNDVNFESYNFFDLKSDSTNQIKTVSELGRQDINDLSDVGILFSDNTEEGLYLLYGKDEIITTPKIEGLEIIPISEALKIYPIIKEKYFFKAVEEDLDEFTSAVAQTIPRGYYIHVHKNIKIKTPIQTAFFMNREMNSMSPHNIVVLEEGSEIHLLTGCTASCLLQKGLHVAISEHYIGRNAKLTNTMIHNWRPEFKVFPKSGTIVEEEGNYINYYYSLKPPKHIEMEPYTYLKGKNSSAKYMTVIVSLPDSYNSIGGNIFMTGENSKSEIIMRTLNYGGTVIQAGLITGENKNTRAHVDCSGLMFCNSGIIEAIPRLRAMHPDAIMTHEAAIGKINTGEINYLQSKGIPEKEAISLIIRGFIDIDENRDKISPALKNIIRDIAEYSKKLNM